MRHAVERHGECLSGGIRYHFKFQFVVGRTLTCDRQFYASDRSNGPLNAETGGRGRINAPAEISPGLLALLGRSPGYVGVS